MARNKVGKSLPYDREHEIKKLSLFITVVSRGQGGAIIKICERMGASVQFVHNGQGTAQREILDILGISDNSKEVIFSLIKKDNILDLKRELEAFFMAAKKNQGIAFSIPLTTVAGVRVYEFLTNSL